MSQTNVTLVDTRNRTIRHGESYLLTSTLKLKIINH